MQFTQPLVPGTLLRRYKRFLADIRLDGGETVTAHCANPGSMLGLSDPGLRVWVEPSTDPKRKLKFSWRLVELEGGHMAGIDTSVPNRVVGEALAARRIPELAAYAEIRAEVRYGTRSRVDFVATGPGLPDAYVEVKNVHLRRTGTLAEFPDSVTARGARHLDELAQMVGQGARAVMLYCIQRTDCTTLALAGDIDPKYQEGFTRARAAGVEALAWACRIDTGEIALDRPIPIAEDRGSQETAWTGR
jgi:sugar fermentation stimulation protein A